MTREASPDEPSVADEDRSPEGSLPEGSGGLGVTRRQALGAAAIGLLAAACRTGGDPEAAGVSVPPSSAPPSVGGAKAMTDPAAAPVAGGAAAPAGAAPAAAGAPIQVTAEGGAAGSATTVLPQPAVDKPLEKILLPITYGDDDLTAEELDEYGETAMGDASSMDDGSAMDDGSSSDPMVVVVDPDSMDPMGMGDPDADGNYGTDGDDGPIARPDVNPGGPINLPAGAGLVANRLTYGTSPALAAELQSLGTGGYVADQLGRTGPDPATEALLGQFEILKIDANAAGAATAKGGGGLGKLKREMTHSAMVRNVYSRHQLYEMMCGLWADHFNINLYNAGRDRHLVAHHQEKAIRPHAMGSFRDLLMATAQSPGMLTYLNNDRSDANSAGGLNENYGRELLELHTLGIDEAGNQVYSEADVRAAARAMTGWSRVHDRKASDYSAFEFRSEFHDTGSISLLNGAWSRAGTSGKATGESLLNFLATHPSTARHVARKLCRRFVSDNPPASLVDSTARVYLANNTEIVPTLRHVLTSENFASSSGQKLRRPQEFMAAVLRALGSETTAGPQSKGAKQLGDTLESMDHIPWGWPQPDGFPDTAAHWLSTDGLNGRWKMAARLSRNAFAGVTTSIDSLRASSGGSTAGDLAAGLAARAGLGTRPADEIQAVVAATGASAGSSASGLEDRQVSEIMALWLSHPIFQTR